MHLKSLEINNFRKFGSKGNVVDFVAATNGNIKNKVAASTTLIVGKNNAGKTTIAAALKKITSNTPVINGNDFNLNYLKSFLENFQSSSIDQKIKFPSLEFGVVINIDGDSGDLVTRCAKFLSIGNSSNNCDDFDLVIKIKYQISETEQFSSKLKGIIKKYHKKNPFAFSLKQSDLFYSAIKSPYPKEETEIFVKKLKVFNKEYYQNKSLVFSKMVDLITSSPFICSHNNSSGEEKKDFKLSELIDVNLITANKSLDENCLSKIFNKIIKYKYSLDSEVGNLELLDDKLLIVNNLITEQIKSHDESVNNVLGTIESEKRLGIKLSSDISFDDLLHNLIKYEYKEFGLNIPENQFGLGYTNLMNIIGEIIDYVERYPLGMSQSKINLICIEEPESFMHPQMQELFIKYIDDAITHLLDTNGTGKKINSQLVITTHSSHILNSKIHSSNSFDNINYVTNRNNYSDVIKLNDESIRPLNNLGDNIVTVDSLKTIKKRAKLLDESYECLKFLKKHIKYEVSALFFSDAIILVEGVTEETLLRYFIDNNDSLKKYYISLFNINGAHAQIYHRLIKLLRIPTLIITDLDIERTPEEITHTDENGKTKKIYPQINTLSGRTSSNSTIKKLNNNSNKVDQLPDNYFQDENLFCVFQKDACKGFFATSFEEALILENYDNLILNAVLKDVKPTIYDQIVGKQEVKNYDNLTLNSYKLQKKLASSKSDFANKLLYKLIVNEQPDTNPSLPKYISKGLMWLEDKIAISMQGGI
jgi:putative ATP-dependent endonuclease of OLD family